MPKKRLTKKEQERIAEILRRLDGQYGTDVMCSLEYKTPWQLLIATILSAQCTDERVNLVTKDLFQKYPSVEAFASADPKAEVILSKRHRLYSFKRRFYRKSCIS